MTGTGGNVRHRCYLCARRRKHRNLDRTDHGRWLCIDRIACHLTTVGGS